MVRATSGSTEFRVPRGFTGRPQMQPNADSTSTFNAAPAQFSADSRFVAFLQYAPKAVARTQGVHETGGDVVRGSSGECELSGSARPGLQAVLALPRLPLDAH